MRLHTQVLTFQVGVVLVSVVAGFGYLSTGSDTRLREAYGDRALAVARTVASDPDLRAQVADGDQPAVQRTASAVRRRTGALFVVVADADGIRLAHPDSAEIGRPLSTDPTKALSGREDVTIDRGTLGESVRAKVPVLAPGVDLADARRPGAVVGLVSVGISTAEVGPAVRADLVRLGGVALLALLVGVAGSVLLARRWRRLTLGLEPDDLADLVREQQAVLHTLAGGIVAVDPDGTVRIVNDEARRLLGWEGVDVVGRPVADLGLPAAVALAAAEPVPVPRSALVGERVVLVSSHAVAPDAGRSDRRLGLVVSVVDRTDVETLTRELDAVRSMTDLLRAQRHESANRLHLLGGLLDQGRTEEARAYLGELAGTRGTGAGGAIGGADLADLAEAVADPHLQAFLEVKAAQARERGVALRLGPQTWVAGRLVDPAVATTVVGNLVDNAVDAAVEGGVAAGEPHVEVEAITDGDTLLVTVADSGGGVADPGRAFEAGVSTKDDSGLPGGRGLGLALARQLARRSGGDVVLAEPGGDRPGHGAVFVARVPGALARTEADA